MKESIKTSAGIITPGTRIRIIKMNDNSSSFPNGIDTQARALNGKDFTVSFIDGADQIHLHECGLALIPGEDLFVIL